jgi:thiamine-phosphate pyrophosphorylase
MRKNKKITKVAIGGIDNYNYEKILLNGADFIAISGNVWKNKSLSPLKALIQFKK